MTTLILLTCTVSPPTQDFLIRANPEQRLKDYVESIRKWHKFCVNHGHDLAIVENSDNIDQIRIHLQLPHSEVEKIHFIASLKDSRSSEEGKSAGEFEMLKYVSSLQFIASYDHIVKVTGRLYVKNMAKVLGKVNSIQFAANSFFYPSRIIDSRVFVARPEIFRKIFQGDIQFSEQQISDNYQETYKSMEHYLTQKFLDFQNSEISVGSLNRVIDYIGYSASTNKKLHNPRLKLLITLSNMFRKLAIKVLLGVAP